MVQASIPLSARVLVIDDNRAIHDDFRKILAPPVGHGAVTLNAAETELFGAPADADALADCRYELDSAYQGHLGYDLSRAARRAGRPYMLAIVDIRMPPGWDGLQTIARLWEEDACLQAVICTAYCDFSWQQVVERLGHTDRLVILKKPVNPVEVRQLARATVAKWHLIQEAQQRTTLAGTLANLRPSRPAAHHHGLIRPNAELAIARGQAERSSRVPSTSLVEI